MVSMDATKTAEGGRQWRQMVADGTAEGPMAKRQLLDTVETLFHQGDLLAIQRIVESQIAINTAGEQERAALWAFVRADAHHDVLARELAPPLRAKTLVDLDELDRRWRLRGEARDALRQYEEAGRE